MLNDKQRQAISMIVAGSKLKDVEMTLEVSHAQLWRWRRNLDVKAREAVHLEDAERSVIVEGSVATIRPSNDLAERLVEA